MGGKMSMIVDGNAKTMYMLMTEQHMYMEFSTEQNSPMTQRMPKFQDMFKGSDPCAGREGATCKKLGTETVNGRSCDKWEITEKSGKTETFWMDQKLHFPIKVSSATSPPTTPTSRKARKTRRSSKFPTATRRWTWVPWAAAGPLRISRRHISETKGALRGALFVGRAA